MRLVTRLTIAFLTVVICMLALHEFRQLDEARADFERDMDRTHYLVATTLADSVELLIPREGIEAAQRIVEQTGARHDSDVRIRWVCLEGQADNPTPPIDCATLALG